jgi:hypothetical protein
MPDTCPNCGNATLSATTAPFAFIHNGKQASIDDDRTVCATCGTVSYTGDQISRHEHAVAAKIRELDGLLGADDLRRIRLKYALRQTDLEAMLSVGPKTWTRWERGKIPQSKAADTLIRVLASDPEVARRLMAQAGIDNPAAEAVFAAFDEATKRLAEARLRAHWTPAISVEDATRHAIDALREARSAAA